ncbi:MAG: hypothetical protein DWQ02_25285 [Bacteroidetes bacterium]|nr:MAG: hypothetical protein DWQ02_25285 [Bacteroidota bacterium]
MSSLFKYSLCFPDSPDIYYAPESIDSKEAWKIYRSFPWEDWLKKEIEHYSPSIEYVRVSDKKIIIFSGIGHNYLEEFQIMYFEPLDPHEEDCFSESNYNNANEMTLEVSPSKASVILQKFLEGNDDSVTRMLETEKKKLANERFSTVQDTKKKHLMGRIENRTIAERIQESDLFVRIAGLVVASLFFVFAISTIEHGEINGLTVFFGLLAIGYLVGAVIYEIIRKK